MKSNIGDPVITHDEVLDMLVTVSIRFNNKKVTYKINYYIYTIFISNHIVVNNRCYLLLLHVT